MTGLTFANYIRTKTKTNATTLTDAQIVLLANVVKDDLAAEIVANVDEGYFDMEMVRDLEANERDYTFANDIVKNVKYATAKLDGTNEEYITEADFGTIEGAQEPLLNNETIKSFYADKKPQYIISGRSLKILNGLDIPAVFEGLKIVGEVFPEDMTTAHLAGSTDLSVPSSDIEHAMPRATHRVWAKMVVIEYKQSREKPIPLTEDEKKIELDLQRMFNNLRKRNAVRSFQASVPEDDGQDY